MKRYISVFLLLTLSACQSVYVPPSTVEAPIESGKVALFVDVKDSPTHTHVGLTVFNNFIKEYPYHFGLQEHIFTTIKEDIEAHTKLSVLDLKTLDIPLADVRHWDFVNIKDKQWASTDHFADVKEKLLAQGFVAVVRVIEKRTEVSTECSNYGCVSRFVNGYGLFSRGIFGINNYQVAPSLEITAEHLTPAVDITRLVSFTALTSTRGIIIPAIDKPKQLKSVTEKEFDVVKEKMVNKIKYFSEHLVDFFNGKVAG